MSTIRLNFLGKGKKTLILFPGWTHPFQKEQQFITVLSQTFKIVLIDLPGYMGNTDTSSYKDFKAHVIELHGALKHHKIKPSACVGFSMGCRFISTYQAVFAEKIPSIYIGSPINPYQLPAWGKILVKSTFLMGLDNEF